MERENRPRVIDTHCHLFPRLGRSGGWNPAINTKLYQYHVRDFMPFWRKDDGARVEEPLLEFPSDDIYDMPDLDFRIGDYGRGEVTIEGVDYYFQLSPPSLSNMEAAPEQMIGEMNLAGVDVGVLQSDHIYGDLNDYYEDIMRGYPGRFVGLAQIREWRADRESELERLERAVVEQGCRGLYFSIEPFALNRYVDHIDDAKFEPLWELVRKLDIPIWWYLVARKRDRRAAWMERIAELTRWTDAHPDIPNLLTHGLVPGTLIQDIGIPNEVMDLIKRPNTYAELQNPAKWPEYPYPEGQELVKRVCDAAGAETLTWGSDMPSAAGFWCTYKQSLDHIAVHCEFLMQEERDLILGGNAARILKL